MYNTKSSLLLHTFNIRKSFYSIHYSRIFLTDLEIILKILLFFSQISQLLLKDDNNFYQLKEICVIKLLVISD